MWFPNWFVRTVGVLDFAAFLYWAFYGNTQWALFFLACGIGCLAYDIIDYFRVRFR